MIAQHDKVFDKINKECFDGKLTVGISDDKKDYHFRVVFKKRNEGSHIISLKREDFDINPYQWYVDNRKYLELWYRELCKSIVRSDEK